MNPDRPRKPRQDGAALLYLGAPRLYGQTPPHAGCPCCDELVQENGRVQLESLMHHGGRRAHRLRSAVIRLAERFRAAAVDSGADVWKSAP